MWVGVVTGVGFYFRSEFFTDIEGSWIGVKHGGILESQRYSCDIVLHFVFVSIVFHRFGVD